MAVDPTALKESEAAWSFCRRYLLHCAMLDLPCLLRTIFSTVAGWTAEVPTPLDIARCSSAALHFTSMIASFRVELGAALPADPATHPADPGASLSADLGASLAADPGASLGADPGSSPVGSTLGGLLHACLGPTLPECEVLRRWQRLSLLPLAHLSVPAAMQILVDLLPYSNCMATSMAELGCLHDFAFDL